MVSAPRLAVLCLLLALEITAPIRGLELTVDRDVFFVRGNDDPCGQLTCRSKGNSVTIDSVKLNRVTAAGVSEELLVISRKSPRLVVSLENFSANGTLEENEAHVFLDLVEMSSCDSEYFTCEVNFTKESGENGKAFSLSGPGEPPSLKREAPPQQRSHVSVAGSERSTPNGLSNPYISELWYLGDKLTKVEDKFSTLGDRLDQRVTQSVNDIHERTSSLESSVLGRVASVETDFSRRLSKLEDRLASLLLSQSQEDGPDTSDASADVDTRLDDMASTLEKLNRSVSMASAAQTEDTLQDKQPATCDRGMGDDVTKSYQPYVIMTHDTLQKQILCDTKTAGGGWIVIQRRVTFDVDFSRDWTEYKNGFGVPTGDFWLGNEAVHNLTDKHPYELRIDMRTEAEELFAWYSSFRLEAESDNFRLRLGSYKGTIGQKSTSFGLSIHNNLQFSTFDKDNDGNTGNHALSYHGGWWYSSGYKCHLNGLFQALYWNGGDKSYSLKWTEMKIRRVFNN